MSDSNIRNLEAAASKGGQGWEITISELDQTTSTGNVADVELSATELAATVLNCSTDAVRVNVTFEVPAEVRAEWDQVTEDTIRPGN